jgi:hypothetical protein|tara:strand:- start:129 stop:344 length:216 start_codon:yes stop_codon:yes gene_type:complete
VASYKEWGFEASSGYSRKWYKGLVEVQQTRAWMGSSDKGKNKGNWLSILQQGTQTKQKLNRVQLIDGSFML